MQSATADVSVNLVDNRPPDYYKHDPEHYGYDQEDLSSAEQNKEERNLQMYGQPSVSKIPVVTSQPTVEVARSLPYPDNHMCLAIFTTLCCCWPLGMVAVYVSNASSKYALDGDYYGALRKAKISQRLSIAGIVLGIIIIATIVVIKVAEYRHSLTDHGTQFDQFIGDSVTQGTN